MKLSAIILSNTANEYYDYLLKQCVNSLRISMLNHDLQIIVVETNPRAEALPYVLTVVPNEKFNYNRFLNIGFEEVAKDADFVGVFNNDLVFYPDWFDNALNAGLFDSFSPISPGWINHENATFKYGYGIGHEFCGWAIVMKKYLADRMFPLDEQFEFWCQDNDMAMRMKQMGMCHALIPDSKVCHIGNQSHVLVEDMDHFTNGMVKRFNEKYL